MPFVNLYYAASKPLTSGTDTFSTFAAAEKAGKRSASYFGTIEFKEKSKNLPFSLDNLEEFVFDKGTHKLQTRDGKDVRVIADDRMSERGYVIVALEDGGHRELVHTYTDNGTFQIGETSDKDLVIVPVV